MYNTKEIFLEHGLRLLRPSPAARMFRKDLS